MDFGEILNEWDRIKRDRGDERELSGGDDRRDQARLREEEARRLARLRPQATLDLHGRLAAEAEEAIEAFLRDAARNGLEKVLIIHGKGNHSSGAPVLKAATRRVLESSPLAGRFGPADKDQGGSGATWVLLRRMTR